MHCALARNLHHKGVTVAPKAHNRPSTSKYPPGHPYRKELTMRFPRRIGQTRFSVHHWAHYVWFTLGGVALGVGYFLIPTFVNNGRSEVSFALMLLGMLASVCAAVLLFRSINKRARSNEGRGVLIKIVLALLSMAAAQAIFMLWQQGWVEEHVVNLARIVFAAFVVVMLVAYDLGKRHMVGNKMKSSSQASTTPHGADHLG